MAFLTYTNNPDFENGTTDSDEMYGLAGSDELSGLAGGDQIYGGEGLDRLNGDEGDDRIYGGDGGDTIRGDNVSGLPGAGDGDDELYGGSGPDRLSGADDLDTASYASSDAGVTVRLDTGVGGEAEGDILSGIESLLGSVHGDTLVGDAGHNRLFGAEGDDVLVGTPAMTA